MNVSPKRFVPEAGCSCGWPRKLKGSAFSAELLPIQKIAPCGCPGLKPRKFPRPPPNPPPPPPPPNPPPPNPPARPPPAKSAAPPPKSPPPGEFPSNCGILRAKRLNRVAQPIHIHAGQRTHRARLPADRHRIDR